MEKISLGAGANLSACNTSRPSKPFLKGNQTLSQARLVVLQ